MKKYSGNCRFVILCAVFFIILTPNISAQVSAEAAQLLRNVNIQVFNQRTEPYNFTLQLLTGDKVTLSDYKGKVVILNFWATWCPPCRAEMPSMENLYQYYNDMGMEMLAVNLRESPNAVRQFIQRGAYTFPVLLDPDGRTGGLYGVEAIPTTYIIDRSGKIAGRLIGSINWDTPQVFAAFNALLSSK